MLGPQSVNPPLHLLFHLVVLLLVATKIIVVIFTTILLLILSLLSSLLFIRSPGTPPGFQIGSTNPPRYQEKLSSSWIWLDRFPARDDHLTQNHKVEKIRSFKRLSYPKIFIKIAKEKWLWFFLSNRILELGKLNSQLTGPLCCALISVTFCPPIYKSQIMYLEKSLYLITLTYCGVFPVVLKQFLKYNNKAKKHFFIK